MRRKDNIMAKVTEKVARDNARAMFVEKLMEYFYEAGEEVMQTKSNEFVFPIVDELHNDQFLRVTVSVPTGTKDDPYDGYAMAQEYDMKCKGNEQKAKKKEAEKAAKIARDEARRAKVKEIHEKAE